MEDVGSSRVWIVNFTIAYVWADQTAIGRRLDGAFTPARAMRLVYGSFDDEEQISNWRPNQMETYPDSWPDSIDVSLLLDGPYIQSGVPKHLLVTWALPEAKSDSGFRCHACPVLIGLTLFTQQSKGWRVEASDLQFNYYGGNGSPPQVYLQPIGPDRFGLVVIQSDSYQGADWESVKIIVPKNKRFFEAFSTSLVSILHDWAEDGCTKTSERRDYCVSYDGGFDFALTSQSDYYDLLLTRRVYRSSWKAVPVGTTVTRFSFDGSKYVSPKANTHTSVSPKK